MKIKLLYLLLILQTVFFVGLYGWHTSRLNQPTVLLRTERIDPRDLLRGDYLILNYQVGRVSEKFKSAQEGETLYAVLKSDGKFFIVDHMQIARPSPQEKFLKGTYRHGRLQYGIEKYFVSEGQGNQNLKDLLTAEVAVSSDGTAQIKQLYYDDKPWPPKANY